MVYKAPKSRKESGRIKHTLSTVLERSKAKLVLTAVISYTHRVCVNVRCVSADRAVFEATREVRAD